MDTKIITHLLNDLITINKNRVTGYKEAIHTAKNSDSGSVALFREMIRQSDYYIQELEERLKMEGEKPADKTTIAGIIYNTWMDIVYAGSDGPEPDNKTFVLQLEETALKAYNSICEKLNEADDHIRSLIQRQQQEIKHSLELIREL